MPPVINGEKCVGCGLCVEICQMDVFFASQKGKVPVLSYPEECWHCNSCVTACPVEGALTVRVPLPAMLHFKPASV